MKSRYNKRKDDRQVYVALYRWRNRSTGKWSFDNDFDFGIVYANEGAKNALIARLEKATKAHLVRVGGDLVDNVPNERVREGWRRNAIKSGAVLATGLGAL